MTDRLTLDARGIPAPVTGTISLAGDASAALRRRTQRIQERARKAGVDLPLVGVAPLFSETRGYAGDGTDWVVGPLSPGDGTVIPRQPRRDLELLRSRGFTFSALYVAHEVPTGRLPVGPMSAAPVRVDPIIAERAVGPVPAAQSSLELAESIG